MSSDIFSRAAVGYSENVIDLQTYQETCLQYSEIERESAIATLLLSEIFDYDKTLYKVINDQPPPRERMVATHNTPWVYEVSKFKKPKKHPKEITKWITPEFEILNYFTRTSQVSRPSKKHTTFIKLLGYKFGDLGIFVNNHMSASEQQDFIHFIENRREMFTELEYNGYIAAAQGNIAAAKSAETANTMYDLDTKKETVPPFIMSGIIEIWRVIGDNITDEISRISNQVLHLGDMIPKTASYAVVAGITEENFSIVDVSKLPQSRKTILFVKFLLATILSFIESITDNTKLAGQVIKSIVSYTVDIYVQEFDAVFPTLTVSRFIKKDLRELLDYIRWSEDIESKSEPIGFKGWAIRKQK